MVVKAGSHCRMLWLSTCILMTGALHFSFQARACLAPAFIAHAMPAFDCCLPLQDSAAVVAIMAHDVIVCSTCLHLSRLTEGFAFCCATLCKSTGAGPAERKLLGLDFLSRSWHSIARRQGVCMTDLPAALCMAPCDPAAARADEQWTALSLSHPPARLAAVPHPSGPSPGCH
jgi:hypothetical protein